MTRTEDQSASARKEPGPPLSVAVVGAGRWGRNLIRNFANSTTCTLRYVCDLDQDRAWAAAGHLGGVRVTGSLDEVLNDPRVDAVAVATPAAAHASVVMACLDTGRHVLVEKPMALSVAEGQKLALAAERRGLVLMCDHTYVYAPAVSKIRELISGGDLGDLHYVDSVRINLGRVQPDIDVLWDLAHHDLSILDYILPERNAPTMVSAQGFDLIGAGRACHGYLTLHLGGQAVAHTHVSWLAPVKVRTTIIAGSARILVWDDTHPTQRVRVYDTGVELAEPPHAGAPAPISYRAGAVTLPVLAETEPLSGVVREFAAAARDARAPLTDAAAELRVLSILEAASQSLACGGAAVPLRNGSPI